MKKRGFIILIILLIIILAGLFLYKKNNNVEVDNDKLEQSAPLEQKSVPVATNTVVQGSKNAKMEAFNIAIAKAQTLFGKGDYSGSVNAYNEALKINKSEYAYSGKYFAELAAQKFVDAEKTILLTIGQNNKSSDYWNWYLTLLQEKLGASKIKLDSVYNQAFESVVSEKKINIVTHYAQILSKIGDKQGAIAQWNKAIEIYPSKKDVYQAEIGILKK
jgi:tetratricopeptide (TPR) repeat protein